MENNEEGRTHLADRVVRDPATPPETIMLTVFLGKSTQEGHTRFYFDVEFSRFIEVPDKGILHAEPSNLPLNPYHVWVDRNAKVVLGGARLPITQAIAGPGWGGSPSGLSSCGLCACQGPDTRFAAQGLSSCGLCACQGPDTFAATGFSSCGLCACTDGPDTLSTDDDPPDDPSKT